MNLNLNVFWTLAVVVLGAPLLGAVLVWGGLFLLLLLGYDPEPF